MCIRDSGYLAYIKPFRTIEDLHVSAAILGYLARIAGRYEWPAAVRTELLTQVITMRTIARVDYTAPEIHIAAAGALSALRSFLKTTEDCWEQVDTATRFTWQRDRALLDISDAARAKRLAAAWQQFK